ncbi:hypothetical protein [Pseudomonas agarici]|uniref:hypothetical protein n=1 Tax=Pseudomonas agarici TaxID=46677 RepID=UPI0008CEA6BE|nr:hypothetical protein [Pseudomonas agarici]NWB90051.1 hypothetical protein [Pseudomonas agarici]NWC08171.1 hypothetical protein [Pseudomonas agarici]SEK84933.1 hypothetical protein SAMN05216604_107133 [Pseudomonas agarici]
MKILKYVCRCFLVRQINFFVCQNHSSWSLPIPGSSPGEAFPKTVRHDASGWFVERLRLLVGSNNLLLSGCAPAIPAGQHTWLDQDDTCNQNKRINTVLVWLQTFHAAHGQGCGWAGLRGELAGVSGKLSCLDNSVGMLDVFYRKVLIFLTELRSVVFFQFRGYCRFYSAGNSSLCAHAILRLSVQKKYRDLE